MLQFKYEHFINQGPIIAPLQYKIQLRKMCLRRHPFLQQWVFSPFLASPLGFQPFVILTVHLYDGGDDVLSLRKKILSSTDMELEYVRIIVSGALQL